MAVKPLLASLNLQPLFLLMNGYIEDTEKIKSDILSNGWDLIEEPRLQSSASKNQDDSIKDTFTPSRKFSQKQIPILRDVLRTHNIRIACVESYNTVAATAAELEEIQIMAFRVFYLKPRVSFENSKWEGIKNWLVSAKELSGINLYRALKGRRPIPSKGYISSFANVHPCYRWYSDEPHVSECDFFIGPVLETPTTPMSPELATFIGDDDVVLVTFGTTVDDAKTVEVIANSLAQRNQKVVVAGAHNAVFNNVNIYHNEWIPLKQLTQKTRFAIVHGGANTVTIMLQARIPMLVVPYFGDQFAHADRVSQLGLGQKSNRTPQHRLKSAIDEMLNEDSLEASRHAYSELHQTSSHTLEIKRLQDRLNSSITM